MSTELTWQTDSSSLNDTLAIASDIGARLKGGEVIELISDLGGGKTSFVRGLAEGMGSSDAVRSPSFTLSNEYKADKLRLVHFDFYRLQEPGIMRDELAELIGDKTVVVAVEWGDIVEDVLPSDRLRIKIAHTGLDSRAIAFAFTPPLQYLLPANT
jgi:tRNA threonylcarbamoyladenosine biosynthesis protein TsaE